MYDRVVEGLLPNPIDRVGISGLMHDKVHQISTTLRPLRMEWHDPMRTAMTHRGDVAQGLFRNFVDMLSFRSSAYVAPAAPRKTAKHARPDRLFTLDEVRRCFTSHSGTFAAYNLGQNPQSLPMRPPA